MLSYRHSFHAGNFADVLKHIVQMLIIESLKEKEKPFLYIDTHAGAGRYQLTGQAAEKTGEYLEGIARLWEAKDLPEELKPYLSLIKSINPSGQLRHYPGSPWIAQTLLRAQDKLVMAELHTTDYTLLNKEFRADERMTILRSDGFHLVKSHLPPVSRRGFVLMDPPYELKEDYQRVVRAVQDGHKRFATGVFAIWYPVVFRQAIKKMCSELEATGIKKILQIELGVKPDSSQRGMTASGMIVVNPPWKLEEQMNAVLPWLVKTLAPNNTGHSTVNWVVGEI